MFLIKVGSTLRAPPNGSVGALNHQNKNFEKGFSCAIFFVLVLESIQRKCYFIKLFMK